MDPQINLDGSIFHKSCAKCQDCNCQITLSNFSLGKMVTGGVVMLCKTHYFKRFHEGGSYLGEDKYQHKKGNYNPNFDGAVKPTVSSSVPAKDSPQAARPPSVKITQPAPAVEPVASPAVPPTPPVEEPVSTPEPTIAEETIPQPVSDEPDETTESATEAEAPTTVEEVAETVAEVSLEESGAEAVETQG